MSNSAIHLLSLQTCYGSFQANHCFRLGIQRSVSLSVLYSPLGSGLPEYEYRKQLTPLRVYIHTYIISQGKSVSVYSNTQRIVQIQRMEQR